MAAPNSSPPTQRQGDTGPLVRVIQAILKNNEYNVGPVDAIFGKKTKAAVIALQRDGGLSDDGVVGPETWALLKSISGLKIVTGSGGGF